MVQEMSIRRILVVDDYEPYRRFVFARLNQIQDALSIDEVSNGLEAVQKAEALKPDLILLDIGLPELSGIEAARRIRTLSPMSKIIFLSQESSADVVEAALNTGAQGYVIKDNAGRDLLPIVDAVLRTQTHQ